jgi:hypothetical protein
MPHLFNQTAFSPVGIASPLLYSYIKLVEIELALKNADPRNWGHGHKLDVMIAALSKPALAALFLALNTQLSALWCEKQGGGAINVDPKKYPHLRYLRHITDFPGSLEASSDADLKALKNAVDDLAAELKREGILT